MIGSGPAGMHAALLLAREGCSVQIFEKEPLPGGMLQYYLPRFRFTRKGIKQKVSQLESLGVKIHLNSMIGKHKPLQGLVQRFDAVVLAAGEWKAKPLGIEGESLKGVSYWTEFLREYNEGKLDSLKGKKAVVIGGGDTAMDCARVAVRLGAKTSIAYRRGRDEMPAMKREVQAAEQDGVGFLFHLSPWKFEGNAGLKRIVFEKTQTKGKGLLKTGETMAIETDIAVIAIGQQPDFSIFEGSSYKSFGYLPEKVVLAGDLVNEKKLIATAVRSAAEAVAKIKNI